jgi:hypothetical protein
MVFVLLRHLDVLAGGMGLRALAAASLVVAVALVVGWIVGGPPRDRRVATSLVTGVRANAVAIALASTVLSADPAVLVGVIVAGVASTSLSILVAVALHGLGRRRTAPA